MSKKPTYEELEQRIVELEKANSELKRLEKELRESIECFRIVLENLPSRVAIHDLKGNILFANDMSCQTSGYSKEELLNMSVQDLDPDIVKRHDPTRIWQNLRTGESVTFKDDGHQEILETIKTPMYMSDGQLVGVLGIGRDITRRKKTDQEKERLRHNYPVPWKWPISVPGSMTLQMIYSLLMIFFTRYFVQLQRKWADIQCHPKSISSDLSIQRTSLLMEKKFKKQ